MEVSAMAEEREEMDLEKELRKLLEQADALAKALACKLEQELGPKLEEAARTVEQKLAQIDWDQVEKETQEVIRKGIYKAREALDKALSELESRRRPETQPPSQEEERLIILRMVAEGKITAEEGARLLEALEG